MSKSLKLMALLASILCSMPVVPGLAQSANTISTDGIAGIKVGMHRQKVAHLLRGHINFGCWETAVGMVSIDGGIVELVQTESPRFATLSGARVGMSETALRLLYPKGLARPSLDDPYGRYFLYSSSGNGVRFSVIEGKIVDITVGKRSAITRESYCS